jgi:hypothetical protein
MSLLRSNLTNKHNSSSTRINYFDIAAGMMSSLTRLFAEKEVKNAAAYVEKIRTDIDSCLVSVAKVFEGNSDYTRWDVEQYALTQCTLDVSPS